MLMRGIFCLTFPVSPFNCSTAAVTNPFAKAAKATTPQKIERSQSLANALHKDAGESGQGPYCGLARCRRAELSLQQNSGSPHGAGLPDPDAESAPKKAKKVEFDDKADSKPEAEEKTQVKTEQKKPKGPYVMWIKENRKVGCPPGIAERSGRFPLQVARVAPVRPGSPSPCLCTPSSASRRL